MSVTTLQQHVEALIRAITESRPGHDAVWEHHGVKVTVYGQAHYALEQPTPWAVIKLDGRQRAFHSWEQVVLAAEELAAQRRDD